MSLGPSCNLNVCVQECVCVALFFVWENLQQMFEDWERAIPAPLGAGGTRCVDICDPVQYDLDGEKSAHLNLTCGDFCSCTLQ